MAVAIPSMGVRSCSVHPSRPFGQDDLPYVRDAGFSLLELSFNRPRHGVIHDDQAQGRAFRRQAESLGMTLVAHAPDQYWLTNPQRQELTAAVDGVIQVLEGAAVFGARALVIHACPGKALLGGRQGEQLEALVHAMTRLAPECESREVCLQVETMIPGRFTSSIENLVTATDQVDCPWIRLCVDTNHANLDQDLTAVVRRAGDRVGEFHLNDNHGEHEEHLLPYAGTIDWQAFMVAVAETGFQGYMVMEPGGQYADDPLILDKARRAADRLLHEWVRAAMPEQSAGGIPGEREIL